MSKGVVTRCLLVSRKISSYDLGPNATRDLKNAYTGIMPAKGLGTDADEFHR